MGLKYSLNAEDNFEGTLSVDATGNVSGMKYKRFISILRGGALNFASIIELLLMILFQLGFLRTIMELNSVNTDTIVLLNKWWYSPNTTISYLYKVVVHFRE